MATRMNYENMHDKAADEMTREEAKEYLLELSYEFGTTAMEYLTEKDAEKMRKAVEVVSAQQPEGKWINVDTIFHIQIYDDEHEEFTTKEMSLADILDAYTDEGCPAPGAAMRGESDAVDEGDK